MIRLTFEQPVRHVYNSFWDVIVNRDIGRVIVVKVWTTGNLRQYFGNLGEILSCCDINSFGYDFECLRCAESQSVNYGEDNDRTFTWWQDLYSDNILIDQCRRCMLQSGRLEIFPGFGCQKKINILIWKQIPGDGPEFLWPNTSYHRAFSLLTVQWQLQKLASTIVKLGDLLIANK